ncbi:hypothetical protein KSS87_014018 [Heliosperma pusillum]|nr:hypothetical protein KSS87_014018 [Heliosperma pusillum]
MLTAQFAQKCYFSLRSLRHCEGPLITNRTRHVSRISGPILRTFANMATASETSCNGNAMPHGDIRRYQVVVAATRDMGIGKDGKLPWTLPSDLRYFKELTTTTSVAGKKNAVIMGRKTWESIPLKYRPLPGRLNVVLSRSGKMGLATLEDLLVCTDLNSALKFLAEPPLSSSLEKVFVIGGGQVLKIGSRHSDPQIARFPLLEQAIVSEALGDTLNAPSCEAIHLTDIKTNVECDTFIPRIDPSSFVPLISSTEMVENNIRFSFLTYVRMNNSAEESTISEEFDYLKQIQERITSSDTFDR